MHKAETRSKDKTVQGHAKDCKIRASKKKAQTPYNEVTNNLNSDKFAAYLVGLLYLYMKAVRFLLQNMNYIERVEFAFLLHYLSLPPHKDMKMVSKAFFLILIKCRQKEKQNGAKQSKAKQSKAMQRKRQDYKRRNKKSTKGYNILPTKTWFLAENLQHWWDAVANIERVFCIGVYIALCTMYIFIWLIWSFCRKEREREEREKKRMHEHIETEREREREWTMERMIYTDTETKKARKFSAPRLGIGIAVPVRKILRDNLKMLDSFHFISLRFCADFICRNAGL